MWEGLLASAAANKAASAAVGLSVILGGGATLEATGVGPAVREAVGVEAPAAAPQGEGDALGVETEGSEAAVTEGEGLGTAESALEQARENAPDAADRGLDTAADAIANGGAGLETAADAIADARERTPEEAALGLDTAADAVANGGPNSLGSANALGSENAPVDVPPTGGQPAQTPPADAPPVELPPQAGPPSSE